MSRNNVSIEQSVKEELITLLVDTGCLKFGQFTLKTGSSSTYYIDLREATMHTKLFKKLVEILTGMIRSVVEGRDSIALVGVPYGVVPLAGAVAYAANMPYCPVRKESKEYGNKSDFRLLKSNQIILIEDVMSTGSSVIETIKKISEHNVTDVIVVVDREGGGEHNLKKAFPSVRLHYILKASEVLDHHNSL